MLKKIVLFCSLIEEIFGYFNCKYTKAYLEFLNYILTLFMRFNKHFKISIQKLLPVLDF